MGECEDDVAPCSPPRRRQMERISKLSRIRKALQRKAQNRSVLDISHIREETAEVPLFTQEGEAVHTDLCYVAKLKRIGAGETVILKGCQFFYVMRCLNSARGGASAAFAALCLALRWAAPAVAPTSGSRLARSGSVTVTTEDPAPLKNKSDEQHRQAEGSAKERSSGGAGGVSEQEMRDLFNSIDADGSGAIDAEELQTALEMMGIQLSEARGATALRPCISWAQLWAPLQPSRSLRAQIAVCLPHLLVLWRRRRTSRSCWRAWMTTGAGSWSSRSLWKSW